MLASTELNIIIVQHGIGKLQTNCLFSETIGKTKVTMAVERVDDESNCRSTEYYIMMKCQFLHHIDTQIVETIDKMRKFDTTEGEVTLFRRNILELIPGADCRMEQMLQEYRQLGLLFTYNIDAEPQFCYRNLIVSSLVMYGVSG